MRTKRFLSSVIVVAFLFTTFLPSQASNVYGASLNDIRGHWAEEYIKSAVQKGFVNGYPDGSFRPDRAVTRAEFTSMLNKALNNASVADITFDDVPSSEWYHTDISKAVAAGYVSGYSGNVFKPSNPITRQEAAVMIARIIPAYGYSGDLRNFPDASSTADWAYASMQKVNGKGYIGPYSDGSLHPTASLTRAQTAKIIDDITDRETIVADTPTVSGGKTLKNTIYSNGVALSNALGSDKADIDNCIIMGTLNVQGGSSVTLSNSRAAQATINKSSGGVTLTATGETTVGTVALYNECSLRTSGLNSGAGFGSINIYSLARATLSGTFPTVNVTGGSANVTLDSGTIENLNVSSGGKYSDITVGSSAIVNKAVVNAESYFHGKGTIYDMEINADGITYETKPRNWSVQGNYDNPDESLGSYAVFSPANKATKVDTDTDITITFASAMTLYSGKSISNSDLKDFITLREGSQSGSKVSFSATINSAKKIITITPSNYLDEDTKYYLTLDKNSLRDKNDKANASYTVYFTTGSDTDGSSVRFSPKNKAEDISIDTDITITFPTAVKLYKGGNISDSDIEDFVTVRKNSKTGSKVSFSASINSSKKVITITPDENLARGTTYYVILDKNAVKDSDGDGNSAQTIYFTTGSKADSYKVKFSPADGDTGVSISAKPVITFPEEVRTYAGKEIKNSYLDDDVIIFRQNDSKGTKVPFSASINSSKKVITVTPDESLKPGQKYYLAIASKSFSTAADDETISSSSVTWTTAVTLAVTELTATSNDTTVTVSVKTNAAGSVYVVLTDKSAKAPSADQVVNGKDGSGSQALKTAANISVSAGSAKTLDAFTGLTQGKTYTVYAVVKSGSTLSAVKSFDIKTTGTAPVTSPTAISGKVTEVK